MTDQIRITWNVTHQHTETFTPEAFAEWVDANRIDVDDPTDLDAVYNALDRRDWRSDEALFALATDRNWLDSQEAEITDLAVER